MTRAKPPSPICCSMRQQKLSIGGSDQKAEVGHLRGEGIELEAVEGQEFFVHEGLGHWWMNVWADKPEAIR